LAEASTAESIYQQRQARFIRLNRRLGLCPLPERLVGLIVGSKPFLFAMADPTNGPIQMPGTYEVDPPDGAFGLGFQVRLNHLRQRQVVSGRGTNALGENAG
jgi:hypothetical protein